jgi:hypothetical protein
MSRHPSSRLRDLMMLSPSQMSSFIETVEALMVVAVAAVAA